LRQFQGFTGFFVVWLGQLVSLLGSAMTRFAITIWAYQETESALVLATVGFFAFGPSVVLSPVAGALVDRFNRKRIMAIADSGAAVSTLLLLLLYSTGNLEIWHLYVAGFINGVFDSFQFPAFSASVTMLVPKEHYGRASGMRSLAESAGDVAAPILAGVILVAGDIGTLFWLDIATFLFAISALMLVHIPQPEATEEGLAARGSIFSESAFGLKYIFRIPSLLGIQLIFFLANLFATFTLILLSPMILASTQNDALTLGTVQSFLGIGGLVGGLIISAWGGPKRRVHGVFLGMAGGGVFGATLLGLADHVVWWSVGAFAMTFFIPMINACNSAIWQAKIAPDIQGRVFAARRMIAQITAPVAMLLSGWLADQFFEPAMMSGGRLVPLLGDWFGSGPGAGMSVLMALGGVLLTISGLLGYAFPVIRDIEHILPDHVAAPKTIPTAEVLSEAPA
jgi:MFS family permease